MPASVFQAEECTPFLPVEYWHNYLNMGFLISTPKWEGDELLCMLVSGVYVRTYFGVGGLRIGNSIAMAGQGYARQNLGESGSTLPRKFWTKPALTHTHTVPGTRHIIRPNWLFFFFFQGDQNTKQKK